MQARRLLLASVLLWGWTTPLMAQAVSTQILGLVTDPSGAVIPGASVKATRLATGDVRTTTTNETGNYIFPVLSIGEYELTCSAQGFKTELLRGLTLQLQDKLRVDFQMSIGEQVEIVEVSGITPLLRTEDATMGTVVDQRRVVDLPLNGRNFAQLATLIPGVTFGLTRMGINGQGTIGTRALPGQMVGLAANGQRDINQNITLDGMNAVETHKNAMTFVPSIEAIQEFKIQSAVYTAEFGGNTGLQADIALKSGTNQFHGTAFEFLRNDKMDARGFFLPPAFEKNHLRRNQYGGVASGPIAKNRTFWLASFEGRRERRGTPALMTVPSPAMRAGDFSEFLQAPNRWTGSRARTITFPGNPAPLPNNIIPQSMIDPVATQLLTFRNTSPFEGGGFVPPANFDAQARANFDTRNRVGTNDQEIDSDQYLSRFDHRFSDTDRVFGRYLLVDSFWLNTPLDLVPRTNSNYLGQNAGVSYSKVLSPWAINDLRFGWLRFGAHTRGDQTEAGFSQRDLGFAFPVLRDGSRSLTPLEEGLPDINLDGYRPIRSGKIEDTVSSVYEISDSVSVNRGKHNFKFGGLYQWDTVDAGAANQPRGALAIPRVASPRTGALYVPDAFAAMLLGIPFSAQTAEGFAVTDLRERRAGMYFLDDYKATSRLTVNFGLRWDLFGVVEDANGRIRTLSFAPEHLQTVNGMQVPMLIPNPNTRASLYDAPRTQIMPRLGVAYRLSNTWVLRTGAGQYYAPLQANSFSILSLNPPFSGGASYFNNPDAPTATLGDPFNAFRSDPSQSVVMLGHLDAERGNRSNFKGNDVWQWNLELERSLGKDLVLGVAYLGSAASNLDISISNFNEPDPARLTSQAAFEASRPTRFYTDSSNPGQLLPLGSIRRLESAVSSNYNALQLKAEKRYSRGLTFTASFNYQKAMGIGYATNENGGYGPVDPQDPRDFTGDYGRSVLDQRFRFVFSHVWELPWMKDASGLKGALLSGWAVNGIVSLTSGLPVSVMQSGSFLGILTGAPRPHIRPGESVERVMEGRTIDRWFNSDAFITAQCETCSGTGIYVGPKGYGNSGVSLFDAPGQKTWDFGLFKNFKVAEGRTLQFRWEAFNFLNTPQFGAPNNILGSSTFGRISSTIIDQREMQFGLKYQF